MKTKGIVLTVSLLAMVLYACAEEEGPLIEAEAMVVDTGSPAVDGCGWLIKIGEEYYKPENLAEKYQVDDLEVSISYFLSGGVYSCGIGSKGITKIVLKDIDNR